MRTLPTLLLLAAPALAEVHIPIVNRRAGSGGLTPDAAAAMAASLRAKYGHHAAGSSSRIKKRQSATTSSVFMTNHQVDSSYSAALDIGTPAKTFNVILDTGSSDLWLAGPDCTSCTGMDLWDPTGSSTFQAGTTPVRIKYGSGTAVGTTGADTVSMGAFTVPGQRLAVIHSLSAGLIVEGVSGLMGLGFRSIAATSALPWWQALVQGNVWTQPLMSFYFTRFLNTNNAQVIEPGGLFTMGGTNTSLYTGDVDFLNLPDGIDGGFWLLPVQTVGANGQNISISGSTRGDVLAAIDTGTTLIGVPTQDVQAFYSLIPGAQQGTGQWEAYMLYPCATEVNMSINYGGRTWAISNQDFQLARVTNSLCAGAVFELNTGAGAGQPSWVVGDTFLKNVYSVFRFNPPSVGFAELAANGDGSGNLVQGGGTGAASQRATASLGALFVGAVLAAMLS